MVRALTRSLCYPAQRRTDHGQGHEANKDIAQYRPQRDAGTVSVGTSSIVLLRLANGDGLWAGNCTVYEDNSACVLQSAGDHQSSKSAHYRRDQATVEELVRSGKMWIQHCPSHLNVADIGTKIVKPISQYEFLTDKLAGYDTELHMSHEMQKLVNDALVVMPIESVDALLAYTRPSEQGR